MRQNLINNKTDHNIIITAQKISRGKFYLYWDKNRSNSSEKPDNEENKNSVSERKISFPQNNFTPHIFYSSKKYSNTFIIQF